MISLMDGGGIRKKILKLYVFVLIFLYYSYIEILSMIGSAMVTIATELFCLNKLLENLR
jgi:hypothetical protein